MPMYSKEIHIQMRTLMPNILAAIHAETKLNF